MEKAQWLLAQSLIETAIRMNKDGLNVGMAGNVSVRYDQGFLITPSAMSYDRLMPEDIVYMEMDGKVNSRRKPSSEWRFHRDILAAKPEVHAVVHTHSPYATTLACCHQDIPAFHYMIAMAGGTTIRCASYALFGTQALSDNVIQALHERYACLLANHGMVACGTSLMGAFDLAMEVEHLCRIYWQTLAMGKPEVLSKEKMAEVIEKFAGYRQC